MHWLKEMHLLNFKGIDGLAIDFTQQVTVLIGVNGIGKSSILQAATFPNAVFEALASSDNPVASEVTKAIGDGERFLDSAFEQSLPIKIVYSSEHDKLSLSWWRSVFGSIDWSLALQGSFGTELKSHPYVEDVRRAILTSGPSHRYRSSYFRFDGRALATDSVAPKTRPRLSESGMGLPSLLSWLATTNRKALNQVEEMLRQVVPGVRELSIVPTTIEVTEMTFANGTIAPVTRQVAGQSLLFNMDRANRPIAATQISEGTLLTLAILTAIQQMGENTLLLVDDLDRGLHPTAQGQLVGCLRKVLGLYPSVQLICTTHSPYLLDHFTEPEVRAVAKTKAGGVTAKRLRQHPDWPRIGESMGLGEFWSSVGETWIAE